MLAQTIDKKLAQTRDYLRLLFTMLGVSRVALATLVAMVVSLFLDWMLEFPQAVRAGVLLIGLVAVGYCVIRFLYRPLEMTLHAEAVAQHIEATHPHLQDGLLTALDFRKDPQGTKSYTSPELIQASLQWAEGAAKDIEPRRVKKAGPVAFLSLGTLLLGLMFAGFFAKNPELWNLYVDRMLLLGDVPWPRHTNIALTPEEDQIVVPRGGSLTVRAVVGDDRIGVLHEFAEIYSEGLKGGKGRVDPMHQEPRGQNSRQTAFNWTFSNINESFSFEVAAGDNWAKPRTVLVKTRPRIEEISTRLFYPLHLAKPSTPEDQPIKLQTIRTVMGTRVQSELLAGGEPNMQLEEVEALLRATLGLTRGSKARGYFASGQIHKDAPMRHALLRLRPDGGRELHLLGAVVRPVEASGLAALRTAADSGAAAVKEDESRYAMAPDDFQSLAEVCGLDANAVLGWDAADSKKISLAFDVRAPTVFYFRLTSNDKFSNVDPVEFTIQAQPDREPKVRMIKPGRKAIASIVGVLPVEFTASDDFGLRTAALVLKLNRNGVTTPLDSLDFPIVEETDSYEGNVVLKLETYGLEIGDRIGYWAEATDFYDGIDHVGRSHQFQIHILSDDDILRNIQGRLNRILEELKALIEQEKKIGAEIASAKLDQTLEETHRRRLLLVQTDQRRVGDNLGKISEEFAMILAELENNQVGDENDRALYRDAAGITGKLATIDIPTVLDDVQLVRKAEAWTSEVSQAFNRMTPRVADVIFELEELVSRLKRWDQVTELSRILSKIMEEEKLIQEGIEDSRKND